MKKFFYLFSIILFVCLWELTAHLINMPLVLPSLLRIGIRTLELFKTQTFWLSLLFSLKRVFISFALTFLLSIILGISSGLNQNFQSFISFPMSLIRSTPVVALIMIVLFWFPSEILPSICAVLMTLPLLTDTIAKAIQNTDKKILQAATIFDFSFFSKICFVYFPKTKPYILGTSKTVFSQTWKVIAAGEILSLPKHALGTMIQDSRIIFEADSVFSLVFILTLLCVLSEKCFFAFLHILGVTLRRHWQRKVGSFAAPAFAFVPINRDATGTASAPDASLKVSDLCFSYNSSKENKPSFIFNHFSISFEKNKITAITAPTGKGKTTLLNILSGIIPASKWSGNISFPKTSFIFQETCLINELSVLENIAVPLFSQMNRKNAYNQAFNYIKKISLEEKAFSPVSQLSGGEKQKIQIARAFAFNAPVILMDEGTNSLDESTKMEIWNCINTFLKENQRTLIFVTHDKNEAEKYADQIIKLSEFQNQ